MNKLPATAGRIKLTSQIVAAVILIPKLFALNNPKNFKLTFPLSPNSAMAKVGMIASTKKTTLTAQNDCHHPICTPNKRKSKKYCTANTMYLIAERDNNFKSKVARNVLKELTTHA